MGVENLTSVTEFILEGLSSHRKTQILLFIAILLVYSFTVLGNLMIIVLVQVDPHLHSPMYLFLSNLSSLEICFVTCTLPQMLAHLLAGNGAISFARCATQMYIATCLGSVECFLLGVMAYDRYLAICHPLLYALAMGSWRPLQLALASWTSGFFLASISMTSTLLLPFCGPNHIDHFFCEAPLMLKLACANTRVNKHIISVVASIILVVPLSVILASYGLILSSVLRMRSAAGRHKAFSTCASHLLVVTMFYGTITFMYMIPQSAVNHDNDKQVAVFYIVVTPLLNPIIYTLRNKDIHTAAARLLRRVLNKKTQAMTSCRIRPRWLSGS
uniref:olfactory receptor 2G3-like n=1 Tax=Euleptes europaea TaxID=460621 RepID=UPI00254095DD|nr:olfactory receptor 2G3-like [Euleptes europaea]